MLKSVSDLDWNDVSVTRASPLRTETAGEPKLRQELVLQERMLASLRNENSEAASALWKGESLPQRRKDLEDAVSSLRSKLELARSSPFSGYMLKLLQAELHMTVAEVETSIENQERRLPMLQARIEAFAAEEPEIRRRLQSTKQRIEHCERRIRQLRKDANLGVTVIRYSDRDILYGGSKVSQRALDEDPNLVLMLREQIYSSDVVIVIAETFAQYRLWMDCELALAQELHRPVLAVIPSRQSECPREVWTRAAAVVRWDTVSVGKALLRFARTGQSDIEDTAG